MNWQHPDSLDGRYFGPLPATSAIARAPSPSTPTKTEPADKNGTPRCADQFIKLPFDRQQTGHASDAMLMRYVRDGDIFTANAARAVL